LIDFNISISTCWPMAARLQLNRRTSENTNFKINGIRY
jgi:hypothetical protein